MKKIFGITCVIALCTMPFAGCRGNHTTSDTDSVKIDSSTIVRDSAILKTDTMNRNNTSLPTDTMHKTTTKTVVKKTVTMKN